MNTSDTRLRCETGSSGTATRTSSLQLVEGASDEKKTFPSPGWYRWVIMCLDFFVVLCCLGTNFGLWTLIDGLKPFFEEYNEGKQEVDTKWIIYINILMTGVTALVANALFYVHRHGLRISAICGAALSTFGIFISGFANSVGYLCFSYGVLTGIGYGLILCPCLGALPVYFPGKFYTFANAAAFLGLPLPILYLRPLFEVTANIYGFRSSFFIFTCINAHLLPIAALFRPIELPCDINSRFKNRIQDLFCKTLEESECEKPGCTGKTTALFCKIPMLTKFIVSSFFIGMGFNILLLHFRKFAQYNNTTEYESETVMVICSSLMLVGLLFHGFVSILKDNSLQFKLFMYTLSLFGVALVSLLSSVAETYAGHAALAAMVGLGSGIYFPLWFVITRHYGGNEWKMTTALGIGLPLYSLGAFLGLVIGDVINEEFSNYNSSFFLAGAALMLVVLLIVYKAYKLLSKKVAVADNAVAAQAQGDGATPHMDEDKTLEKTEPNGVESSKQSINKSSHDITTTVDQETEEPRDTDIHIADEETPSL
ncbi:monocarboxylate transporter 13-like [Glandiceps talaboti]